MLGRSGIIRRIGNATRNSLAVVGLGTTAFAAHECGVFEKSRTSKDEGPKRRVLVLPFHRMNIVEHHEKSPLSQFFGGQDDDSKPITITISDLLESIYEAAEDPEIVALYATFGHSFNFKCGGYAHIEEIRRAIRVFNESHRRHMEPFDGNDEKKVDPPPQKFSYAFADTFEKPGDDSNKEYFLASAFSHIHMQPRGGMNLFGLSATNLFFKKALENYGIKPYIFRRGSYKNAPNMWTEDGYTKEHLENTQSILDSINKSICEGIVQSRNLSRTFNSSIWKSLYNYGTMTAENALEIKLVDFSPSINPLKDLMEATTNQENFEKLQKKWGDRLDLESFKGQEALTLKDLSKSIKKRKANEQRKQQLYSSLEEAAKKSSTFATLLSTFGEKLMLSLEDRVFQSDEKIAIVSIDGAINEKTASAMTNTFHQLKSDEKVACVVLRINSPGGGVTASETILEECKDMSKPIICSFGNLAASGGYYIAMSSDKIFASQTTLTGSIGVFGGKLDFSGFAHRHGVVPQSVLSGKHGNTYSPFQPLSPDMKMNLNRNIDRTYSYFKQIVSEGRNIELEKVEELAGGRVWTGEEAQRVGLIDEIGGIDRAISYAKERYTTTGNAYLEYWPKKKPLLDTLRSKFLFYSEEQNNTFESLCSRLSVMFSDKDFRNPSKVWLTMDEQSTLDAMISELLEQDS